MTWRLFNVVAQVDRDRLEELLHQEGYAVRALDGSGVGSAEALWRACRDQLGIETVRGWDGFADRMWAAILPDDDESDRVALLWYHTDILVSRDLQTFLTAFDVLTTIGRRAYEQQVEVLTFYLGEGLGYPSL